MLCWSLSVVPNGAPDAGKAGVDGRPWLYPRGQTKLRTNVPHIFAIGDIVGRRCWRTKAFTKAAVAAEAIAGRNTTSIRKRPVYRVHRARSGMGWPDRERSERKGIAS